MSWSAVQFAILSRCKTVSCHQKKSAHQVSLSHAEILSVDPGSLGEATVFVQHGSIDSETEVLPEDSEEMVTKEEIAGPALHFKRNPKILQLLKPFSAVPSDVQHYETFGIHEFGEWSKIQWMVENLFHIGWLLIVWGPWGAGKTAWLIDLMLTILPMARSGMAESMRQNRFDQSLSRKLPKLLW